MKNLRVLSITTSNNTLRTGVWFGEVETPFYAFKSLELDIDIKSIIRGNVPINPTSKLPEWITKDTIKFKNDIKDMDHLNHSLIVNELNSKNYD